MKIQKTQNRHNQTKKRTSIRQNLLIWFLILSLLPLIAVSWVAYQQANQTLYAAAERNLRESANLTKRFISSWFNDRITDAKVQAQNPENLKLLTELSNQFNKSGLPLLKFVRGQKWEAIIKHSKVNLIGLLSIYHYINDVYLIDSN